MSGVHEITSQPIFGADFSQVRRIEGYDRIKADHPTYLSDESKFTAGSFDYLFFPRTEAELSAVVREMSRREIPITIAGARTGLVGGCVPSRGALVSLEHMDRVQAVYWTPWAQEWRIRAETGVSLAALNRMAMTKVFPDLERCPDPEAGEQVRRFREDPLTYFYPPDPTEMSATVGGTVATNASGARTYRYGSTRDWVRGLRVMLINGEILDIPRGKYFPSPSGWFTVYDSAGRHYALRVPDYHMPRTKSTSGLYASPHMDLVDLFVGSEGSFGIVTTVDVALLPWEPKCSIVQFTDSDEQTLDLVEALRSDKRLQLDFLEFYSANALNLLRRMQGEDARLVGMPPIPDAAKSAVFFELSFDPLNPTPDYRALEEVVSGVGASLANSWAGYESRELARFKLFRHLVPEKVSMVIAERKKVHPGLHRLSSDLAVTDEHLREMWAIYQAELDAAGIQWVAFGHIGNNHIHVSTMPRDMEELAKGVTIFEGWAKKAVEFGGTVSAEHGIGKIKAKFLKTMYSPDHIAQMRSVKAALDPAFMLNPGNIFTE